MPNIFDAPWRAPIEDAVTLADLAGIYNQFSSPDLPAEMQDDLVRALNIRKAELEAPGAPATREQVVTSLQKLAQIEEDSYQAQLAYATALDRFAKGHTNFKTAKAKAYLRFKTTPLTGTGGKVVHMANAEADMHADADDEVAAARLEAYISEGMVKAARSNLDRLERSFQYHRSLMVNERAMDARPGA